MIIALTIIHIIICLALVIIVLMQEGKQQGLSGAIAGGAETFFGKNKGRSMDGMLKKITAVLAALFIICSITLAIVAVNEKKAADEATDKQIEEVQQEAAAQAEVEEPAVELSINDKGELVDAEGVVIATAEAMADKANFNEAGDLINPATKDVIAKAADIQAAKDAANK